MTGGEPGRKGKVMLTHIQRRASERNRGEFVCAPRLERRGRVLDRAARGWVEALETRQLLSGVLDPTFGTGGKVVTDFPDTPFDGALGPAVQSTGKIVAQTGESPNSGRLVRYTANGQLDPTFGSNGVVVTTHRPGALAVRGDDKIVVVIQNSPDTFLIARYTANGQVDTTFGGGDGQVVQPVFGGSATSTKLITKILVRPDDGRTYVVGSADVAYNGLYQFAMSAYDQNGDVYNEFGDSFLPRTTLTEFGYSSTVADAVMTPDGHIYAVGTLTIGDSHHPDLQQDFAVARYDEHGVPDTSFSGDGKTLIGFGEYPRTGNYETNDAFDAAHAAALDAAGNLLIAGTSRDPSDDNPFYTALARVRPDGSLDPAFGPGGADGDGRVTLPLRIPSTFAGNDVEILPSGKVVLATDLTFGAGDAFLSLLNANGSPDPTFGTGGKLAVDFGAANEFPGGLLTQSGKALAVGGIWAADDGSSLAMARYLVDGTAAQAPFGGAALALPGTLQFENYDDGGEGVAYHDADAANIGGAYRNDGADVQAIPGGGYNLGFAKAGEWVEYTVDVPAAQAGSYNVGVRYASLRGGGKFHLEVDGTPVTATTAASSTGSWQAYQTRAFGPIYLAAGRHVLRLAMDANDVTGYVANFDSATFTKIPGAPQTPFGGTPIPIGDVGGVEFENFDDGGEGVSYHDTEPANLGGAYRNTGVDVQPTAEAGKFAVAFAKAGEWTEYTLDVARSGSYSPTVSVAALAGGGKFHLELDGRPITAVVTVPGSNSWQRYTTVGLPSLDLPAGRHVLRLVMDANGPTGFVGNFDRVALPRLLGSASTPFHGTPVQPNQVIEAEDFDIGGDGFSYHDADAQNLGSADYRPGIGVDIEPATTVGGYNVGFAKAGEWLQYTIDGGASDNTSVGAEVNLASLRAGGRFHLELDGQTVATFTAPATGSWQTYATLSSPRTIHVAPGKHALRLVMDQDNPTGYVANFNWLRLIS
jgi:uncharacterized delta-60 repeat protein